MADFKEEYIPCVECHAGVLLPRRVTYLTWLGTELITVPQFPAWVCDVCGRREYDERAVQWLNILLDPNAGKPASSRRNTTPQTRHRDRHQPPMPES